MEIYTINNSNLTTEGMFNREVVIDDFNSVVWTERFFEAGEVEIVLPAVHQHLKLLAPGKLLGCRGSRQIMLLETRSIEDGMVKATGKTIEAFFNERVIPEILMSGKGGDILKGIVNHMQFWVQNMIDIWSWRWTMNVSGIDVAATDPDETGPIWTDTIPSGPVYDTLVTLGKKYKVGQSVIWTKVEGYNWHKLVYTTRQGKDLTQGPNFVRFSTDLENLANAKQLLSIAGSKNMAVIIPPEWVGGKGYPTTHPLQTLGSDENNQAYYLINASGTRYTYGAPSYPAWKWNMDNQSDEEYNRFFGERYIIVDCTDLTKDKLKGSSDREKETDMFEIMDNRQRKALREHKKIKIIDGEVTPGSFVYKQDYDLGDLVQIEGDFGDPIDGVITEFVRSQDETGERSYPTVSTDADAVLRTSGPGEV